MHRLLPWDCCRNAVCRNGILLRLHWSKLAAKPRTIACLRVILSKKLAIQYSVSNPRIGTTLFSSANPDNVLKNIQYIEEPIDWDLVAKVKEIIGDQQRVTWKNT